ncbi:MAG: hypothetical protein EHM28_10615 [Spirochaetaceae bacterium]|nr:MAG: hypothetical protein EHM28_10615 [Spirochaetaceae bacterium]
MTIVPKNKFFLYSDGLLDGIDHSGVRFGEKRIQAYFMSNVKIKPDAFIEGLLAEYNEHIKKTVQVDDLSP